MSFGLYIRQRRIEMGYGLNEFSGRIGISPAYWSRVERGIEKAPRDELIEKTASLLGMSVDELFLQAARLPPDMQKELPQVVSLLDGGGDANRRGAPSKFDWDDIWVELCAMIFLEGIPETQAELVQHVAAWLEGQGKRVPDDSTIKKKIKPLWHRLRPQTRGVASNLDA